MGVFNQNKKSISHGAVETIIGSKTVFKGDLESKGAIHIGGQFEGNLKTDGEVILAPGSKVIGTVCAGSVVVSGQVEGNIYGKQGLEITKSGRVNGDLIGGRIIIEEGSSYTGRVKVEGSPSEAGDFDSKPMVAAEEIETA